MGVSAIHGPTDQPPLQGRRVLVIEDEYFLADDICSVLKDLGAEIVGPAGEVREAVVLVNSAQRIDAAVLDVNLKNESTLPIADGLRTRSIPFVFTTGYDRSAIDARFGDIELFEKPINIMTMARSLARLLGEDGRKPDR
jgi:CheY-like chemotaxis protein